MGGDCLNVGCVPSKVHACDRDTLKPLGPKPLGPKKAILHLKVHSALGLAGATRTVESFRPVLCAMSPSPAHPAPFSPKTKQDCKILYSEMRLAVEGFRNSQAQGMTAQWRVLESVLLRSTFRGLLVYLGFIETHDERHRTIEGQLR